jgi:hypothetical protein
MKRTSFWLIGWACLSACNQGTTVGDLPDGGDAGTKGDSGTPACTASNCNGCCAVNGTCLLGTDSSGCGVNGAACAVCGNGQVCALGVCTAAQCLPSNCNGCCDSNGSCRAGTIASACGAGGASCAACVGGQACSAGACVTNDSGTPCGPTNCSGCCDASGACQLGTTPADCGSGGGACVLCGLGQTCSAGACTFGGTGDAGLRVFITSASYSADLKTAGGGSSGVSGADNLCNLVAQGAGLSGSYQAWLSNNLGADAITRITAAGPWFQYAGGSPTIIFRNKAELAGLPLAGIQYDELGRNGGAGYAVWTGTNNGGHASTSTCTGFTDSTSSGDFATTGSTGFVGTWTQNVDAACTSTGHLYCFQQ